MLYLPPQRKIILLDTTGLIHPVDPMLIGPGFDFPSELPPLDALDPMKMVNVTSLPPTPLGGTTYVLTGNTSGGTVGGNGGNNVGNMVVIRGNSDSNNPIDWPIISGSPRIDANWIYFYKVRRSGGSIQHTGIGLALHRTRHYNNAFVDNSAPLSGDKISIHQSDFGPFYSSTYNVSPVNFEMDPPDGQDFVFDDCFFWLPSRSGSTFAFEAFGSNEFQRESPGTAFTNRMSRNLFRTPTADTLAEFKITPVIFYRNTMENNIEVRFRHGFRHIVRENYMVSGGRYNFRDTEHNILNNRGGDIELNAGNMTIAKYPQPDVFSAQCVGSTRPITAAAKGKLRIWPDQKDPGGGNSQPGSDQCSQNLVAAFDCDVGGNDVRNIIVGSSDNALPRGNAIGNHVAGNSVAATLGRQSNTNTGGSIPGANLAATRLITARTPTTTGTRQGTT